MCYSYIKQNLGKKVRDRGQITKPQGYTYLGNIKKKDHTFRPKINPISAELVRRNEKRTTKKVWKNLYSLDKEMKEKRDRMYIEKKITEEDTIINACTFKPKLIARQSDVIEEGTIYQRSTMWNSVKNERYWKLYLNIGFADLIWTERIK